MSQKVTATTGFTLPSSHQFPRHIARSLIHSIFRSPSHSPKPFTRPATHPNHSLAQPLTQTNHSLRLRPAPTRSSVTHLTQNLPNLARTPSLAQPLTQLTQPAKLTFSLVCFPVNILRLPSFTVSLSTCRNLTVVHFLIKVFNLLYQPDAQC